MPSDKQSCDGSGDPVGPGADDAIASWEQGRAFGLSFAPDRVRQCDGRTLVVDDTGSLEGEVGEAETIAAGDLGALLLTGRGGLSGPHAEALAFGAGDSYALAVWAHCTSTQPGWQTVVAKSSTENANYGIWVAEDDSWCFGGADNLHGGRVEEAWQHVVAVQDATKGERRLYVDGKRVGTLAKTLAGDAVGPLLVGCHGEKPESFRGLVGEVSIWQRALTDDEVKSLHAATCRPGRAALVEAAGISAQRGHRVLLAGVAEAIRELEEGTEGPTRGHLMHVLYSIRAAGWDVDYETLMCLTGTAFSFWYQHDNYHVSYSLPDGWVERITEATGFGYEDLKHENPEDVWRHIRESVDSGRVVNAEWMEGVSFLGYEETEDPQDRRVFAIDSTFQCPGAWWDWAKFADWYEKWPKPFRWVARHSERVASPSMHESALAVLRRIPCWAEEDHRPEDLPEAHFGLDGIAAYAADIADLAKDTDYIIGPWRGCHAINPQWAARGCPPVYLRRVAEQLAASHAPAAGHVSVAADGYEAAYKAWQEWNEHLGGGAPKGAWESPEHRQAGAAAVRAALDHERTAVQRIKEAVAELATNGG